MVDNSLDPAASAIASGNDLSAVLAGLQSQSNGLTTSANGFASAMTRAFTQASAGGKQLDTVLQSLALRISGLAVAQAFEPSTRLLRPNRNVRLRRAVEPTSDFVDVMNDPAFAAHIASVRPPCGRTSSGEKGR